MIALLVAGCIAREPVKRLASNGGVSPAPVVTAGIELLPRDSQGLAISPFVRAQLVHLMQRAVRERKEPAACVAPGGYTVRYVGEAAAGRPQVDVWALTLANADSADSVHVWYAGRACDDTLPLVHGHMVPNRWLERPSPIDEEGVHGRQAPFNLLVYPDARDSLRLRLYWRSGP